MKTTQVYQLTMVSDNTIVFIYGKSLQDVESRLSKDPLFCSGNKKKYKDLKEEEKPTT